MEREFHLRGREATPGSMRALVLFGSEAGKDERPLV